MSLRSVGRSVSDRMSLRSVGIRLRSDTDPPSTLTYGLIPTNRPTAVTLRSVGRYQTVHWTIMEDFAMVTVNTKMRNLQNLVQYCCMLTRLHDGSDRRQLSSLFITFSVKVSGCCIAQGSRHIATRTVRYTDGWTDGQTDRPTDRPTDLAHLVAAAVRLYPTV